MKYPGKIGFIPIAIEHYLELHLECNPGDDRKVIESALRATLADYKAGAKCHCGNPIRVIGSALVGNACFTCITGEATPDDEYEIKEAIEY